MPDKIHPKARIFLTEDSKLEKYLKTKSENPEDKTSRKIAEFFMYNIKPFYKEYGFRTSPIIFNMMLEAFKNSYWHGGDFKPHTSTIRMLLSPTSLISQHNDQGNYFRRPEIKKAWENKLKFPEKHKVKTHRAGYGVGTGLIYSVADFIYVDTKKGDLYLGTNIKNKNNFSKI